MSVHEHAEIDRGPAGRGRPGRRVLIREALGRQQGRQPAAVVADGVEAMSFLRRAGRYADAPRPT